MSGHSKWATTKHQKAAKDKTRAKVFAKILRQVEVAAREGGSDLEGNPTLRTMYQKARDASIPMDTLQKAIKRGSGELEGVRYEPITYEGYAPGGIALLVETLSDNRNRTGAEIRNAFSKNGGSIAEPGAVSWQFDRKGSILLPKSVGEEDDVMMVALEAGAEDLRDLGEMWQVVTPPSDLHAVRTALEEGGMKIDSGDLVMLPSQLIQIDSEGEARKVLKVVEALEDHDDVQNVYANFDLPDAVLELIGAD